MALDTDFLQHGTDRPFAGYVGTYEVMLTGEIEPYATRDGVIRAMAVAFRRSATSVSSLLDGKPRVVKRGLRSAEVERYLQKILETGARAVVRNEATRKLVTDQFVGEPSDEFDAPTLGSVSEWTGAGPGEVESGWSPPPTGGVSVPRGPLPPPPTAVPVANILRPATRTSQVSSPEQYRQRRAVTQAAALQVNHQLRSPSETRSPAPRSGMSTPQWVWAAAAAIVLAACAAAVALL